MKKKKKLKKPKNWKPNPLVQTLVYVRYILFQSLSKRKLKRTIAYLEELSQFGSVD